MATNRDELIVAGAFSEVGALSVPNIAKLTVDRSSGYIETSWSIPTNWGQLSALASGKVYFDVATDSDGGMAACGDDSGQPFVYCPSSGSCTVTAPYLSDPTSMTLSAAEVWSETGRFLVGGDFQESSDGPPASNEFHGLAQYNAGTDEWEWFGQPAIGEYRQYWIEADGVGSGVVRAIKEVALPGKTFDRTVFIGGSFGYVFGKDWDTSGDLTFSAANWAYLTPEGTFWSGEYTDLPGEVLTFAQSPSYAAGDGGTYLYAAGLFGYNPNNGDDRPAVLRLDISGQTLTYFNLLHPGDTPPYAGPRMSGAFTSPIVFALAATDDYLYAVGDFDQVRDVSGPAGSTWQSDGFARYSFVTGEWQPLQIEDPALHDVARACVSNWPVVFVGGDFTTVGASIPSYHIAQADFDAATGAPEQLQPESVVGSVRLGAPAPSPARRGMHLAYSVPQETSVELAIFDVAGRRLTTLVRRVETAGEYSVDWDGRTAAGAMAAPGVYFVRLVAAGEQRTQKVTLVR